MKAPPFYLYRPKCLASFPASIFSSSMASSPTFRRIEECSVEGRSNQTVAAELDGGLLISRNAFPYYMLIALEAGSLFRSLLLLASFPYVYFISLLFSEALATKALIFVAVAGLKVKDIEVVARSVLPRFYADDVHPEVWRVFSSFGKRYVVTANPRIMAEAFAKAFLGADEVVGTELEVGRSGRATGFVSKSGVLAGESKKKAVERILGGQFLDVGIGSAEADYGFSSLGKV